MGGTLEVLLVSAQGIRHTNIIGKPTFYVVLECGTAVHRSKTTKVIEHGDQEEEIFWNEKFVFELPKSEVDDEVYLKLKIMDEEVFSNGKLVGETTIYLKGLIIEGKHRGFIEVKPAPYNVVLDDDTFHGEIKIGLLYSHSAKKRSASGKRVVGKTGEEGAVGDSLCRRLASYWQSSWLKFLFGRKSEKLASISSDKRKVN